MANTACIPNASCRHLQKNIKIEVISLQSPGWEVVLLCYHEEYHPMEPSI